MTARTLRAPGLLALALLLPAPAFAWGDAQVYFSPRGGGADATTEAIRQAAETIDVAMYSISTGSSNPIFRALEEAVDRGVRVRLILHNGHTGNRHKARALEEIGVHVYSVTRTLHEKFAVIDARRSSRTLVNGSANWSHGAEHTYSENTVVYAGGYYSLIYAFQEEFNRLLAQARPLSPGAEDHMDPASMWRPWWTSGYEEAVFTSNNSGPEDGRGLATDAIIEVLRQAQESILVDQAHFDRKVLADVLIELRQTKPHLEIEVLLDQGELSWGGQSRRLEAAGIPVRYKTYSLSYLHPQSQLMHHKNVVVDERTVVTGSFNWSKTAEFSNFENIVILRGSKNRGLVQAFVDEHRKLWDMGRDLYPAFLRAMQARPGDAEYKRYLPVHFNTDYFRAVLTLTRAEVDPIYAVTVAQGIPARRSARFWDREGRRPYDPPGSFQDGVDRMIQDWGRFLDPLPGAGTAEAPAPADPAAGVGPATGLSGAVDGTTGD